MSKGIVKQDVEPDNDNTSEISPIDADHMEQLVKLKEHLSDYDVAAFERFAKKGIEAVDAEKAAMQIRSGNVNRRKQAQMLIMASIMGGNSSMSSTLGLIVGVGIASVLSGNQKVGKDGLTRRERAAKRAAERYDDIERDLMNDHGYAYGLGLRPDDTFALSLARASRDRKFARASLHVPLSTEELGIAYAGIMQHTFDDIQVRGRNERLARADANRQIKMLYELAQANGIQPAAVDNAAVRVVKQFEYNGVPMSSGDVRFRTTKNMFDCFRAFTDGASFGMAYAQNLSNTQTREEEGDPKKLDRDAYGEDDKSDDNSKSDNDGKSDDKSDADDKSADGKSQDDAGSDSSSEDASDELSDDAADDVSKDISDNMPDDVTVDDINAIVDARYVDNYMELEYHGGVSVSRLGLDDITVSDFDKVTDSIRRIMNKGISDDNLNDSERDFRHELMNIVGIEDLSTMSTNQQLALYIVGAHAENRMFETLCNKAWEHVYEGGDCDTAKFDGCTDMMPEIFDVVQRLSSSYFLHKPMAPLDEASADVDERLRDTFVGVIGDVVEGSDNASRRLWSLSNASQDVSDNELRIRECGDLLRACFDRSRAMSESDDHSAEWGYLAGCLSPVLQDFYSSGSQGGKCVEGDAVLSLICNADIDLSKCAPGSPESEKMMRVGKELQELLSERNSASLGFDNSLYSVAFKNLKNQNPLTVADFEESAPVNRQDVLPGNPGHDSKGDTGLSF